MKGLSDDSQAFPCRLWSPRDVIHQEFVDEEVRQDWRLDHEVMVIELTVSSVFGEEDTQDAISWPEDWPAAQQRDHHELVKTRWVVVLTKKFEKGRSEVRLSVDINWRLYPKHRRIEDGDYFSKFSLWDRMKKWTHLDHDTNISMFSCLTVLFGMQCIFQRTLCRQREWKWNL